MISVWQKIRSQIFLLIPLVFILLYLLFFTSLFSYLWVNRWLFLTLTSVFLLGAIFLKINASAAASYPNMFYWVGLALASGFYYYVWQQPELFAYLFHSFFHLGIFSLKKSNGFFYGLTSWVGIILISYSLPFLWFQKNNMQKKLPPQDFKFISFTLSMFFYLIYLNISVTLILAYFHRF